MFENLKMKGWSNMDKIEIIVEQLNNDRKRNKDNWLVQTSIIQGVSISIKSYNTWVQGLIVNNGIRHSSNMDMKVSEFKQFLKDCLEYEGIK